MRVHALTRTTHGVYTEWVEISPASAVGRMFCDPTVSQITIERTPDGEILKGAKTTVYERTP